jgi:RimJ/RimL family protein N-acetyltransferase
MQAAGAVIQNSMMGDKIQIKTERFLLRPLQESDATTRYLSWFGDSDSQKHIYSAPLMSDLLKLRNYIRDNSGRADVLFFGIFSIEGNEHIGNIKFTPIDREKNYACFGVLIAPEWRGRGASREVVAAASEWFRDSMGITRIVLGVGPDNTAAIRAYEKMGFELKKVDYFSPRNPVDLTMVRELSKQEKI